MKINNPNRKRRTLIDKLMGRSTVVNPRPPKTLPSAKHPGGKKKRFQ